MARRETSINVEYAAAMTSSTLERMVENYREGMRHALVIAFMDGQLSVLKDQVAELEERLDADSPPV
jgi:ubiquinone biosynthesis protein UbiJ